MDFHSTLALDNSHGCIVHMDSLEAEYCELQVRVPVSLNSQSSLDKPKRAEKFKDTKYYRDKAKRNEGIRESILDYPQNEIYLNVNAPVSSISFSPVLEKSGRLCSLMAVCTTRSDFPQLPLSQPISTAGDCCKVSNSLDHKCNFDRRCVDEVVGGIGGIGSDELHVVGEKSSFPNSLSLWLVTKPDVFDNRIFDCAFAFDLLLGNVGTIIDSSWYGSLVLPSTCLLAVLCGNGTCIIYEVDIASPLLSNCSRGWELRVPFSTASEGKCCSMSCMSWSNNSLSESTDDCTVQLCTGLEDGSWVLWTLHGVGRSGLSKTAVCSRKFIDFTVNSAHACVSQVVCIAVCPYNSDFVASGGLDGVLKVWYIDEPYRPVYSKKLFSYVMNVQWDPLGFGLYYTDSDSCVVSWDPLWYEDTRCVKSLYGHILKSSTILQMRCFVVHNEVIIVSSASDGTVRQVVSSIAGRSKPNKLSCGFQLFQILQVIPIQELHYTSSSVLQITGAICIEGKGKSIPIQQMREPSDCRLSSARVAVNALDTMCFAVKGTVSIKESCHDEGLIKDNQQRGPFLVAYGGAAGVIRLHWFDEKMV